MKKLLIHFNSFIEHYRAQLFWLLRLGTVAILIGVPVYPKFPLITVPGTYVSIRAEDFLIGLVFVIWIMAEGTSLLRLATVRMVQLILFFLAVGWLSTVGALLITQTVDPLQIILHTIRRFEYILLFFFMYSSIQTKDHLWAYVRVILLALFLVFLYGMGQKAFFWPIISTMNKEYSQGVAQSIMPGGRINSTFAGHYDLAAYAVMMMGFVWGTFKATRLWGSRLWAGFLIIVTFWLLIVSASRISFAAYLASIVITLWFLRMRWWIIPVLVLSLFASARTPALTERYIETIKYEFLPRITAVNWPWEWRESSEEIALLPTPTLSLPKVPSTTSSAIDTSGTMNSYDVSPEGTSSEATEDSIPQTSARTYSDRSYAGTAVEFVALPEDRSTAIRFKVEWPRAIRAFVKNPLLGTGYSSITLATDNDYLRALGETGFLGLLSLGLILVHIFVLLAALYWRYSQTAETYLAIGIGGGIIGFLANAMFIDVLEASKVAIYFWGFVGILVATARLTFSSSDSHSFL